VLESVPALRYIFRQAAPNSPELRGFKAALDLTGSRRRFLF
jgi:hypothetical protein